MGLDQPQLGPIGFPQGGFVGFPGRRFGFFGFPRHRFGFFFDGFFDGFVAVPLVDGFVFFPGFPFVDGFRPVDGFLVPGFPHRRFGFFGFPHRRFGFFPWFGGRGGGYVPPYTTGPYPSDTLPSGYPQQVSEARPVLGRQLAVPGTGSAAGDSLIVERVTVMDVVPASALRLTWRSAGLPAEQVALFVADSTQAVLAAQTVRAPPFTGLLQPPPGTAFAGVTVAWPDGTTSTRLVPYRFAGR